MTHPMLEKLAVLADAAKYDASCASSGSTRKNLGGIGNTEGMGICHSYTPDGRCVSLLKILLTNYCLFDCSYCVNRASSDVKRAKFTVEEVVDLTLSFYRRNYIEGLFLSSGVMRTPDDTMTEMIEIARRLREDHKFGGYIHLKAVAGSSSELLLAAGRYADRLSANIEFPSQKDLTALAPAKSHGQIVSVMTAIKGKIDETLEEKAKTVKAPSFAPAGQSTQMIVGATDASDQTILRTSVSLYQKQRLRRVYYTAFSPIPHSDPRLPLVRPPLQRENRLYQADWLLRFYGFSVEEIAPPEAPDLALDRDPKLAWAMRNPQFFPVDVNKAPKEALWRVPGLGVRNVQRVLQVRRHRKIRWDDLKKLRVPVRRAKYFLLTADDENAEMVVRRAEIEKPKVQLNLFEDAV